MIPRFHERYQLAPAVTKNAPDKNLEISFQLIFITRVYNLSRFAFSDKPDVGRRLTAKLPLH
jgi:hypothetical protein